MYILLPELLRETLAQGSEAVFASRERAGVHVAPDARGSSCEQQGAPRATLVQRVLFEREDGPPREGKGRADVVLQRGGDVFLGHLEERLEYAGACIPKRDAQL